MLSLVKALTAFVIAAVSAAASLGHAPHPAHHATAQPAAVHAPAGPFEPDLTVSQLVALAPTPEPAPAPAAEEPAPAEDAAPAPEAPAPAPVQRTVPAPRPVAPQPPPPVAPQPPPVVVGSGQQAYINGDRAAAGLGPLTWSSCLAGVAAQNAARMAAAGAISHAGGPQADLACGLSGSTGENVGYWSGGINDGQLNSMFMNSAGHRANIMGPYHYVGTAWRVAANGAAYIAVEFS